MKLSRHFALALALAGALTSYSGAGWAVEQSPYAWQTVPFAGGGYVDGFGLLETPGLLYARTNVGGLYRYDYQAQQWNPLFEKFTRDDRELMGVLAMALDPNDANKIYVACGLYLNEWAHKGAILRSPPGPDVAKI